MLNQYLEKWEQKYGTERQNQSPEERFAYVIERAYESTGKQAVVLVDEYDKPLLQALSDEGRISPDVEGLLWRAEEFRPLLAFRVSDGSHQVCPGQCIQWLEPAAV